MRNHWKWEWLIGLFVLVIISTAGCGLIKKVFTYPLPPEPEHLSLSSYQPDDIPVPMNFRHLPDQSIVYIDSDIRTAEIRYVASERLEIADVAQWYERYMPSFGWQKLTDLPFKDKKGIVFTKEHEVCNVIIDKTSADETTLLIKINAK